MAETTKVYDILLLKRLQFATLQMLILGNS